MLWQTLPLPAEREPRPPASPVIGVREGVPEKAPEKAAEVPVRVPLAALEDLIEQLWEEQRKAYAALQPWLRQGHPFELLARLKVFAAQVKAHRGRLNLR